MCAWHAETMAGLDVPNPEFRGKLRGSPGLEHIGVRVGRYLGAPSAEVSRQVMLFETRLQLEVNILDTRYQEMASLDGNGLIAVIRLAAWAHAEWIRIHPFANGNGRTARMWANFLFMRYGLPPAIQLRPRPGGQYAQAGDDAMKGSWKSTEAVFLKMLGAALSGKSS